MVKKILNFFSHIKDNTRELSFVGVRMSQLIDDQLKAAIDTIMSAQNAAFEHMGRLHRPQKLSGKRLKRTNLALDDLTSQFTTCTKGKLVMKIVDITHENYFGLLTSKIIEFFNKKSYDTYDTINVKCMQYVLFVVANWFCFDVPPPTFSCEDSLDQVIENLQKDLVEFEKCVKLNTIDCML